MIYPKVLVQVQEFVRNYYSDHLSPNKIYHNLKLTEERVDWAAKISQHYKLDNKDRFIIEAATWFYGICYTEDPAKHEKKDASLAEKTLKGWAVPEEIVKGIRGCILASRIPRTPKNLKEQIFCDVVQFYLGQEDFSTRSKVMRKEYSLLTGKTASKEVWKQRDIQFLKSHRFKTEYAKQLFAEQQEENLKELLNQKLPIQQQASKTSHTTALSSAIRGHEPEVTRKNLNPDLRQRSNKPDSDSNDKNEKEDKKRPDRGIETMFRISSNTHQALSQMADNKAHIMITVNSIIISVLLSVLFRSLDNEPHLAIPVAILLSVNVVAIIFSILATRPNIPPGNFSKEDVDEQRVNLLFFGNFYKMQLNDYAGAMTQLMEDRNFLYNSLIKNLHQQGLVLGRKYRFLRISYNVFMYGLIIAILAFGLAMLVK